MDNSKKNSGPSSEIKVITVTQCTGCNSKCTRCPELESLRDAQAHYRKLIARLEVQLIKFPDFDKFQDN